MAAVGVAPSTGLVTAPHGARLGAWLIDGAVASLVYLGSVMALLSTLRRFGVVGDSLVQRVSQPIRDLALPSLMDALFVASVVLAVLLGGWLLRARFGVLAIAAGAALALAAFDLVYWRFYFGVDQVGTLWFRLYDSFWSGLLCTMWITTFAYGLLKDGLGARSSIGKQLCGLKVVRVAGGAPCTLGGSAVRALVGSALGLIPIVGGFVEPIAVLTTADARRVGDRAADTRVVRR